MKYLYWTYIDAVTGVPCTLSPMRNGPANPAVAGLEFGFALESRYPTNHPIFYGTCRDDADTHLPGVLGVISEAEYHQASADEWTAHRSRMTITRRQARLALARAGLLEHVAAAIAAIEDPAQRLEAQIEWDEAATIERLHPWVQGLAAALGLDDAALDTLFATAAAI